MRTLTLLNKKMINKADTHICAHVRGCLCAIPCLNLLVQAAQQNVLEKSEKCLGINTADRVKSTGEMESGGC